MGRILQADELDGEEVCQILRVTKKADFAPAFGRHIERILLLWSNMPDTPIKHTVLQLIVDLQTTNSPQLFQLVQEEIEKKYGTHKHYQDMLRLVGMRSRDNFQGALSNVELLVHMQKGNFVFHTGGWGIGEIVDVSMVREQLSMEFDYVAGRKDMSFTNAFKTLIPVPNDHFSGPAIWQSRRFRKKAKEDPVEIIRILLRDLGPKSAAEIKDELCDLVIPAADWTKWWQMARAKIKKDTMIETPEELKLPFRLRLREVAHEDRLVQALEHKPDAETLIQMVYAFLRDFPETLKNVEFRKNLQAKLKEMLSFKELNDAQELQIHFFLRDLAKDEEQTDSAIVELLKRFPSLEDIVMKIDIIAFKKRALIEIKEAIPQWPAIFLNLLFPIDQNTLRDYLLGELINTKMEAEAKKKLQDLWTQPTTYPDAFLWYFQKVMGNPALPFGDAEGRNHFFEAFLILLSAIEHSATDKELVKKMHGILTGGRFAIVRDILQKASLAEVKEFLLLATKCHSLGEHDIKILYSLAEVVHPSIGKDRKKSRTGPAEEEVEIFWTTQEGYQKLQQRIQQIATVETVENAKEIEIARAHGDLRENSEFKFALEKRDRLQSELKTLSDQLARSRVLTKEDVRTDEVTVGVIVECANGKGKKVNYTLLGPWDADPDRNILSFQSKLAQAMKGLGIGDQFQVQGESYTIQGIRSYFE